MEGSRLTLESGNWKLSRKRVGHPQILQIAQIAQMPQM